MKKYAYAFVEGVDGFGADVAPAYEEGIYLDFDKAWKKFVELTQKALDKNDYFESYDENDDYKELTDANDIAKNLYENFDEPCIGWYLLVKVEIKG